MISCLEFVTVSASEAAQRSIIFVLPVGVYVCVSAQITEKY